MSNEKLFNNLREEIEGLKIKIWQLDGYPPYNSKHNKLPTDKKQQKEIINIIKKEKASLERILGTVSWMKEDGLLKKPLTKSKKGGRKGRRRRARRRKTKKRTLRKKNRKGGVYSMLAKKAIKNNALKYPKIHMARYEKIDPKDLITKKTIKNVYPNKHPGRYGGGKKKRKTRRKNKY